MNIVCRVSVYPYTGSFAPYLTPWGQRLLAEQGIHIQHLVSPPGLALAGKDSGEMDRRDTVGIPVESDFDAAVQDSDALLLAEGKYTDDMRADILRKAKNTLAQGMRVLSALRLSPEELTALQACCASSDQLAYPLAQRIQTTDISSYPEDTIYAISTPVICVGEMVEGINGTDVMLALWDYFTRKGQRCAALMPDGMGALLGATDISQWFHSKTLSQKETIQALSERLHQLDETVPDIILIQIPGNLFSLNNTAHGDFGICAYMLTQAIAADCFVMCAPYKMQDNVSFDHMAEMLHYRFMLPLDYIHVSNAMIDFTYMHEKKGVSRLYVPLDDVEAFLDTRCGGKPMGNVLRDPDALCLAIADKLLEYAAASAII